MFGGKKYRGLLILAVLSVCAAAVLGGCGGNEGKAGAGNDNVYTIADSTGDWGFPSPYAHYTRGPAT